MAYQNRNFEILADFVIVQRFQCIYLVGLNLRRILKDLIFRVPNYKNVMPNFLQISSVFFRNFGISVPDLFANNRSELKS